MLCWTILLGERSGVSHESVVVFQIHSEGHWTQTIRPVSQARMLVEAWLAGCVDMHAEVVPGQEWEQTMHCTAKANRSAWRVGRMKLSNASLQTATTGDVYNMPRIQNTADSLKHCCNCVFVCVSVLCVCVCI